MSLVCQTLSNAFVKSRNTPINSSPLSTPLYSKLQIYINWCMVLSPWMNPDCILLRMPWYFK